MSGNRVQVEPLQDERGWEQFVIGCPQGTFFHTPKWKMVLENSFPLEVEFPVIRNQEGRIIGGCPLVVTRRLGGRVMESLPYSEFSPIFDTGYLLEAVGALKAYLSKSSSERRIAYARIRCLGGDIAEYLGLGGPPIDTSMETMTLDLQEKPSELIWNQVFTKKSGQRKYIRRFEQAGYRNRQLQSEEDIKTLYTLYCKSLQHLGEDSPHFKFFENMYHYLYPNTFNAFLTENEQGCIGALGFFVYPEKSTVYLVFLGLDRDIENKFHTSYYLYWEAIKWAVEKGFRYVSFGPNPCNSIYHSLKGKFGATSEQLYVICLPFNSRVFFFREKILKSLWRAVGAQLPLSLRRRISRVGGG